MNKVWKANKPAKGEIKQKEQIAKQYAKMKYRSNGPAIKSLKMKHIVILTFLDLWGLFCRLHNEASEKDQGRLNWVNLSSRL